MVFVKEISVIFGLAYKNTKALQYSRCFTVMAYKNTFRIYGRDMRTSHPAGTPEPHTGTDSEKRGTN